MNIPAKMKNTITIGGVTTCPTSMLGISAAIAVDKNIAAMHSIKITRINIRKLYGFGFNYTIQ
jgi:hypothetical protein